jgi:hypothetical protein
MACFNTAVMVVRCSTSKKLMTLHANQAGYTSVTSAFMAPPTSIHLASMKVRAPGHSIIHHSGSSSMYSCCGHSPMASLPLLVTSLSLLLTSANPLAWFSPPFLQIHSNPSTMPRECGKLKRGPLYYNFIVRATLTPHIYPLQPAPPEGAKFGLRLPLPPLMPRTCLHPFMKLCMILEAARWRKKFIILSCSHWKPHSSLARPLEHGSCLVEEEIPLSSLVEWIARNSTPGLDMEETPPTDFDMDTTLLRMEN